VDSSILFFQEVLERAWQSIKGIRLFLCLLQFLIAEEHVAREDIKMTSKRKARRCPRETAGT
jgi:hypothetical protein